MSKNETRPLQSNFEAWVATIDERIFDWLMKMGDEEKKLFDYSPSSLDEVERYLIGKYTIEDLRNEHHKFSIDGAASYVYCIFMKNLPNYQCLIEFNDDRDNYLSRH
jgi:hypothetical protein